MSIRSLTQEDPIGLAGGLNLYGFAEGDPVNFSDPFGLCKEKKLSDVFRCIAWRLKNFQKGVEVAWAIESMVLPLGEGSAALTRLVGAGKAANTSRTISASALRLSETVAAHADDISSTGQAARPYVNSKLVMQEVMNAAKPVADPGGVPGALRWDVPGALNGTAGTWQLVVNPETKMVLHFLFVAAK